MTLALSTFYRTALSKGADMVTVETCIRNIEAYLEIQLIMHDNDFKVEWNIDPSVQQELVPKLALQPIVENALEHGLDVKEEGEKLLKLYFFEENGDVVIRVEDNGIGMEQEQAEKLLTYQAKGYGLKNVNDRMCILYGEKYAIRILSKVGEGTSVDMRIPKEVKKMRLSLGKTVVFLSTILSLALLTGCSLGTAEMEKTDIDVLSEKSSKSWEQAETTPLGKYPELVTYTLGQMKGANNSNLPDGQTYEDNAYTRYLKKTLNIQNKNVFMESEERYDEALNILVKDRNLPDVFLVSDRETLEELVENDLIEDLTEVYKSCASDKIKEMYESYGEELLASGTFDGKLYALPETAIDDGQQLLWLRHDWMEQLGLKEPRHWKRLFQ